MSSETLNTAGTFSQAKDLKNRILFTILLLIVYRLGTYVPLSGVDPTALKEIMESDHSSKCLPLNNIKLNETLPIIKNCKISICNDSSFSHLSAALNIPTIVLMSDTPLLYGNYSPRMYPIIPDWVNTVTHDTLGKDKINPKKIFEKFKDILN